MTRYELASCAVCGTARARQLATQDDARRETELLWEYHTRRLRAEVPTAHLMDRVAFSQHPPLRLVRCTGCGLVYRNPVERPSELSAIYEDEGPTDDVMRALHETQRPAYDAQAARLGRVFGRRGTGLEVGSYVGGFLAAARDAGWQFAGTDVSAGANRFTRGLGFTVHDGTIEELDPSLRVDVVAIWNCLDQLADPASALRAASERLSPGGMLAVRVPNGACYALLRARLRGPLGRVARAVLAQNNLLAFPYRYGFTPRALSRLVERMGLRVERVVGDVLVPIADEWTRPWAAMEERALKRVLTAAARLARGDRAMAPWFELYARKSPHGVLQRERSG